MPDRSVTLLVVLLLVLGATAPAGALVADARGGGTGAAAVGAAAVQPENGTTNDTAAFGASVSAFVQTSAADAEGEVDDGVFSARFQNASNETRESLVRDRTDRLADRIEQLRDQRTALLNTTGNLTVAERARAARLAARIDSLQSTLNVTEDAARTAGVNETRLATLREQADELSGPEVAEIARGLAGGPDRSDRGNGPPADVPGNRTDGPGEGPPEDVPGNRTDDGERGQGNGPPEGDRGQGNDSDDDGERGQGNGPPEGDRGQGNDSDDDGNSGQGNGPPEGDRGQGNSNDRLVDQR